MSLVTIDAIDLLRLNLKVKKKQIFMIITAIGKVFNFTFNFFFIQNINEVNS